MNNICKTCLWWSEIYHECYSDNPGGENCWTNPFDNEERVNLVINTDKDVEKEE